MIVTGEIEPGQRILAKDVASRFGVSHIPVREAMRRLEGEGLLRYHSQRGAVATDISLAELAEIYDLRRFLECRAAAAAVSSFDDEYVGRVRDALAELERTRAEDPHGEAFFDAHHSFHWLLIAPGCSALVERMLRHLWSAADRYVHLGLEQAPTPVPGATTESCTGPPATATPTAWCSWSTITSTEPRRPCWHTSSTSPRRPRRDHYDDVVVDASQSSSAASASAASSSPSARRWCVSSSLTPFGSKK